jgi:hypothetical protein
LSEALNVVSTQLSELEEQAHKHSHSPSKKNNLPPKISVGKKKDNGNEQSTTPRSGVSMTVPETSHSFELGSPSSFEMTFSSPAVQQLFLSLNQEIRNWKILTTCRLLQAIKLHPLPLPKGQEFQSGLLSSSSFSVRGNGEEEKKDHEVDAYNMRTSRNQVDKLKRFVSSSSLLTLIVRREIRLTRASVRIPVLSREGDRKEEKWNERTLKELKQISQLSSMLHSLQVRIHSQTLHR